jgi:ABC transporter DrrB family efflux protein
MRSRKLLKSLVATPMRREHFLGAIAASRIVLVLAELAILLAFGRFAFGVPLRGSVATVLFFSIVGALSFSAVGMLVAARTAKTEVVSGLMNLVMLPMFVFSGVFFSSERFPDALQPVIRALPLTALNDALRAVILEGAGLGSQLGPLAVLAAWGLVAFAAALRWFRWS